MKRILNCFASDFKELKGKDLLDSIQASEGRTIVSEIVVPVQPLYPEISNPEIVSAFGADLLLLNMFDVNNPAIAGIDSEGSQVIKKLKELTGRPIGINLEPVDPAAEAAEELLTLPVGRTATTESLLKVKELGIDFVCLTGNPKTGVTNDEILKAISNAKTILGDDVSIIAGKMHGAGVKGEAGHSILNDEIIEKFIHAGASVILIPSPGTVPGITVERANQWVSTVHQNGALAMLTIGTSQEGADSTTIKQIALQNKMVGADLHHIGDAGYTGIAIPENIMDYSIAIRGKRHTYIRMAASINR
ncbi:haloacid dehalogenase-like hydrolase [Aquibacillus halophilus]|uniref:Haloacid dehalogenase-like hydrolase n=1 Tax=Aquibacillus halophilus TaxID=930132 RepID=A0A6A8D6P0_9BACI|nr:haloacid dehalogenase-like hydrolase [Aquibacillus halophilus]MRH41274.1 haloacid dehalogenase-like hydrolase [Aquibacillus halophilus]